MNDNYGGSPCTHKDKWKNHDWFIEPLEFFDTRDEAIVSELKVIKSTINNPMSLNEGYGSKGLSTELCRKNGRLAVESGQLEQARTKIDPVKRRERAIQNWENYNARPPEERNKLLYRRPICLIHPDGTEEEFPSASDAGKKYHLGHLNSVLHGHRKHTKGFTARFI